MARTKLKYFANKSHVIISEKRVGPFQDKHETFFQRSKLHKILCFHSIVEKRRKNLSVPKNVIIEEENSWVKASKYICSAERETKTSISLFL